MRIPDGLEPLVEYGILDEVIRPLMSGKEAQIYLVRSKDKLCVAKVYKDTQLRTFKNRADYTEGRKVRNSRDQRAIGKRSKHGRAEEEAVWRSTEVDVIHRLHAGGVRVPVPYHFVEGVLLMELVADAEGHPAPRLGELQFEPDEARAMYDRLIREVVRMLCVGVVHGDLSGFNVLVGGDGPVIIDFPQSVDTAHNTNARKLLVRDVENLHNFLRHFVPGARRLPYAEEMWDLYQKNLLTPDTPLSGRFRGGRAVANVRDVLGLIQEADDDERTRRRGLGVRGGPRESARAIAVATQADRTQDAGAGDQRPRRGDQRHEPRPGYQQQEPRRDDQRQEPRRDDQRQEPRRGDQRQEPRRDDQRQEPRRGDQRQEPRRGDQRQEPRRGDQRQEPRRDDQRQEPRRGDQRQEPRRDDRRQEPRRDQRQEPRRGDQWQEPRRDDRRQDPPNQAPRQQWSPPRADSPQAAARERPNRPLPPEVEAPPPRSTSDKRGRRRAPPEVIVMYRRRGPS